MRPWPRIGSLQRPRPMFSPRTRPSAPAVAPGRPARPRHPPPLSCQRRGQEGDDQGGRSGDDHGGEQHRATRRREGAGVPHRRLEHKPSVKSNTGKQCCDEKEAENQRGAQRGAHAIPGERLKSHCAGDQCKSRPNPCKKRALVSQGEAGIRLLTSTKPSRAPTARTMIAHGWRAGDVRLRLWWHQSLQPVRRNFGALERD